jgi:hypothetical protein
MCPHSSLNSTITRFASVGKNNLLVFNKLIIIQKFRWRLLISFDFISRQKP